MIDYTLNASCTLTSDAACQRWAHQNRQGSVVAVTDSTGAVVERHRYGAYGEIAGSTSGFPFRFTGQKLDPETGLYHYKARFYDPETGRFLQTDPIGYRDQMNLYAYVGNDPVNATDPTGECPSCAIGFVIGAIAEVGVQVIVDHKSLGELDGGRVLQSAAIGAISGGIGGASAKLASAAVRAVVTKAGGQTALRTSASKIAQGAANGAVAGASSSASQSAITQQVETGSIDGGQVLQDAAVGAVLGSGSGAAAGAFEAKGAQAIFGDARAKALFNPSASPGANAGAAAGTVIDGATAIPTGVAEEKKK